MHTFSTPFPILKKVVERLIDQLEISKWNCFISEHPDDEVPTPDNVWIVVSPNPDDRFNQEHFVGGGQQHTTIETNLIVTVHVANQQDQAHHADEFLGDDKGEGVYPLSREIIKALAQWMPETDNGEPMLHQPFIPANRNIFRENRAKGSAQISFTMIYDLDLT